MIKYDMWISCIEISNSEKIKLVKRYGNSENVWYHMIHKDFDSGVSSETVEKLRLSWEKEKIERIAEILVEKGIKYVTYFHENYPQKLREISNPPFILFYYGDIEKLNSFKCAAVVGSRKCSPYGINVTKLITKDISDNNIIVISGMAKGIDSAAHGASLDSNGYTCAVLGCGIDIIYPRENVKLYNRLMEDGCIISEFLPGTQPYAYNFPLRNRIISALSNVIIIVEAGIKSGSLITATNALEQGKDIIAVPGSIFSEQSKGTNRLIKDGAFPFTCMEDIYDILGIEYIKTNAQAKKTCSKYEHKVSSIITDSPIHIDEIIKITDIDIKLLYELLFEMQLRDEIMCLAGNYYVKINNNI